MKREYMISAIEYYCEKFNLGNPNCGKDFESLSDNEILNALINIVEISREEWFDNREKYKSVDCPSISSVYHLYRG